MTTDQPKLWFITGVSSGLGKALAEAVIHRGDFAIGTMRNQNQVNAFNEEHAGKALALELDITDAQQVKATVELIEQQYGRLDVLVNNAGFGFAGSVEESSLDEIRAVFEANFFGAVQVTQAALPLFRKQKSGHIIQISSHGGFKAMPGFGIYNASKFALEGVSEALAGELAPLGVKVTIVEPGPFRTNFAGQSFRQAERQLDDYNATAGLFRERMSQVNGKQEGDPEKAAQAILTIANIANPPLRLPLGKTALTTIRSKIDHVQLDLETWAELAETTVFV